MSVNGPEYAEMGTVYSADRIDDLARQLTIEPLYFTDSIERYNQGSTQHKMGKDTSLLTPLQTPPFYAIPLALSVGKLWWSIDLKHWSGLLSQARPPTALCCRRSHRLLRRRTHWLGFSGSISAALWQGRQAGEAIIKALSSEHD